MTLAECNNLRNGAFADTHRFVRLAGVLSLAASFLARRKRWKHVIIGPILLLAACGADTTKVHTRREPVATTTTTVAPTTTTLAPSTLPPRASRLAATPRYAGPINDDTFIRLSWCESGGRADAVSRSGKYFGAFQFSLATWRSIGMTGNPIDYPYEVQLAAAKRLQARSGWGQWPVCSRKLGLR